MLALILGAVAVICGALLFWQSRQRAAFMKREVLEAKVARVPLVAVAMLGLTLASGVVVAAMSASLERWTVTFSALGVAAVAGVLSWFSRGSRGALRLDGEHLTATLDGKEVRVALRESFVLDAAVKLVLAGGRRAPVVIAVVTQGPAEMKFWFPFSLGDLPQTPSAFSEERLPPMRLDWRGAVIYGRLRARSGQ